MAVYFDHRLETDQAGISTDLKWFSGSPLLAVTSYSDDNGGAVTFYTEEGEKLPNTHLQKNCHVTSVSWHPNKKIVAVGWETGELLIWNEQERSLHEAIQMHKSAISVLHWSSNGTRIASGDKSGILIVWKVDTKGRLNPNPLCQHHIQEPLTHILARPAPPPDPASDIASLARAAVSGDESALDMFNWKRGKNNSKTTNSFGQSESLSFFVGGASGGVYYVNENGQCIQCFTVDSSVRKMLYYDDKNILITITDNMMLTQHAVLLEGDTKEMIKVKLSGRNEEPHIIWAGKGLLATATGEVAIRMWDLEQDDNYVLSLDAHSSYDSNESIMCVAYCAEKGMLAGGTNMGNVALWKFHPTNNRKIEGEDKWKLQAPATVEGPVRQIQWGSNKTLMAINTIANVFVLSEQVMSCSYQDQTAVVQYGPSSLSIEVFATGNHHDLKTDIQVKGVCTTKDVLAVWNGKRVIIYEYSADKLVLKAAGSFTTEAQLVCLYEQNVYTIEGNKVQVRTFQGTIKQHMTFSEVEGNPCCINICGNFLAVATEHGTLRVYDLSRREAKAHSNPKNISESVHDFGTILSARCNCSGNRVSVMVKLQHNTFDSKLYVWDVETDSVQYFNFQTGRGEQDDYPPPDGAEEENESDTNDAERGKNQAAKDIAGRRPTSHYWDPLEPKLLVCEAMAVEQEKSREIKRKPSLTKAVDDGPVELMVVSLFCTQENGILIQDSFSLPPQVTALMGVEVPYHYFIKRPENTSSEAANQQEDNVVKSETGTAIYPKLVFRKVLRDFVGLENSDKGTRDAMMNFSYYLTIGNMDEAFKAIKLIKSESVWENMAKMCVKSRRLDVAYVCLGNMGHARGAKALREAHREAELDARVATLAIQLGLFEDAERLLKNCKRYDLLNEFYQSGGQWGKALETAEMYDRIHLRTTYYNYARHLEENGNTSGAIPNFEKSETHRFEVPRMLYEDPESLEQYIQRSKDKSLRKWWAQFMESNAEMDVALQFYEEAQDFFSLVRVYCFCGQIDKAAEVCNETGDKAACYYLARQYENQDQIKEAIHFFTRSQAFGSAIRLCKEHGQEEQLLNLALLGRPEDMMEAARYYEQHPRYNDKAVMLYHKAGNFSKALDLAFKTKQFGALQLISGDLDERADPELLQQCADFFLENGQYDKAVDLLAIGKKYIDALKICMERHVEITEDLADKLTPEKVEGENDTMDRLKILEGIADVCMHQGQYHIATKKFTQAGNKMKAMKALLKSGDTEKIVFFAGVSRQREIYVMAANYLQSLDWRKDPEIMKSIIGFYTKGRALDLLAGFYDACAQVEIDEYQNYDKALGALGEAYKCLSKAKVADETQQEEKLAHLKHKMTLIKKFVQARRVYEENSEEAMKQCQVLLEETDLDSGVRVGDVLGFMIEHFARRERWKAAYSSLEELRSRLKGGNPAYYVNTKTIEAIHRALDVPLSRTIDPDKMNGFRSPEDEEGDFIEEDVADDSYGHNV
ncbi:intraflagellar transport protein 140 homolog [Haliotis cracherodii]|uniref:intraflagellar transport protein 140 homolog n=1 Tax=Haliotis cracherodii TaxID=6455 RepID=UPI0039E990D8